MCSSHPPNVSLPRFPFGNRKFVSYVCGSILKNPILRPWGGCSGVRELLCRRDLRKDGVQAPALTHYGMERKLGGPLKRHRCISQVCKTHPKPMPVCADMLRKERSPVSDTFLVTLFWLFSLLGIMFQVTSS